MGLQVPGDVGGAEQRYGGRSGVAAGLRIVRGHRPNVARVLTLTEGAILDLLVRYPGRLVSQQLLAESMGTGLRQGDPSAGPPAELLAGRIS